MNETVPLPVPVETLIRNHRSEANPSLLLDKYVRSWANRQPGKLSEQVQLQAVNEVAQRSMSPPAALDLTVLTEQRREMLSLRKAVQFTCRTVGPLTLHLSRSGALENAGICLHELYGFAYLPGSGLKGMARAYAETVWLPAQQERGDEHGRVAELAIKHVFGWADDNQQAVTSHSGRIIFHDAWPTSWPLLVKDLLNNHHRDYYSKRSEEYPPGDWESPVMVYFLAVAEQTEFEFAVAPRRIADPEAATLVDHARQWLIGALVHEGAGAKTAAGYGRFLPPEGSSVVSQSPSRRSQKVSLTLASPAFLAGPDQQQQDCNLRCATLRGLLRWWWRTMHSGFVNVNALRQMEAVVWGDTEQGGAVRLSITSRGNSVLQFPGSHQMSQFCTEHGISQQSGFGTQGYIYASYGVGESLSKNSPSRPPRYYSVPGSTWDVEFSARDAPISEGDQRRDIPSSDILQQALAACWLLSHYGGVGSKSRNGLGSLQDPPELKGFSLAHVAQLAEEFRRRMEIEQAEPTLIESPALNHAEFREYSTDWKNAWFTIDQIGATKHAFAQAGKDTGHGKHRREKVALGLPRKIHGPKSTRLKHQKKPDHPHWPPKELGGPKGNRYASPILYHIARNAEGELSIRVTLYPTDHLWDADQSNEVAARRQSRRVWEQLLEHCDTELPNRIREFRGQGSRGGKPVVAVRHSAGSSALASLETGQKGVPCEIVPDPKGKGRPFAKHLSTGLIGSIFNKEDVPQALSIGAKVSLDVKYLSANRKQVQFLYPKPTPDA